MLVGEHHNPLHLDGVLNGPAEPGPPGRLTCALYVVDTFLDEERDGALRGHQGLEGNAKVVALPGSPGRGVERLRGFGCFGLRDKNKLK